MPRRSHVEPRDARSGTFSGRSGGAATDDASGATVGTTTVLFTDLAGSTEVRARLGEEAAEHLRGIHDHLVVGAIEAHRGRVVKHLGDGMMATFTAAANAVAAAVGIQQAIDEHNRKGSTEPLAARVGISVGDVTIEGNDCFGLPVIEAQRLEDAARPGTILCAELVVHLARGRGGHRFEPLGALTLKGLPEAITACEVRWEPLPEPEPPPSLGLPPLLVGEGLPLCGRKDQFARLQDAWKRTVAGGFEIVLLAGEPGIGKTRLAAELGRAVLDTGGTVLAGRCDEDLAISFRPFVDALAWFVDRSSDDHLAAALGRYPGELTRLVPAIAERLPGLPPPLRYDAGTERHRLLEAVTSWLASGGTERPSLVVLDDLHWADKASLLLLRHLVTAAPAGLLVVGTYRDTDLARTHPLADMLAEFRREDAVTRVALSGLEPAGVQELVERAGGQTLDDQGVAFCRMVHEETAGNPFFVGEVLRHLAETGALVRREGRWTSDLTLDQLGIPEGIREVIGRRLSRLGDETESVLRTAAVIGHEFDLGLVATVLDRSDDDVLDALERAMAAGLVAELGVDRYRFAHALVRETLHGELSSTRRVRQHRLAAQALERLHAANLDPVLADLARHWIEASTGGDPARAVELALRAGDQAVQRLGYDEAVRWYERALELLDGDEHGPIATRHVLARLASAQQLTGEGFAPHVYRAAELALDAGDLPCVADALEVSGRQSFDEPQAPDLHRIDLLERALAMDVDMAPFDRARLLLSLATELIFVGDFRRRQRVLDELEAVEALIDDTRQRRRLVGPGRLSWRRDNASKYRTAVEEQLQVLSADTTYLERLSLLAGCCHTAVAIGDRAVADRAVRGVRDLRRQAAVDASGAALKLPAAAGSGADVMMLVLDGSLADAEAGAFRYYRLDRERSRREAATSLAVQLYTIRREQDRLNETIDRLRQAMVVAPRVGPVHAMVAFAELRSGNPDAAAELLDSFDADALPDDAGLPIAMALFTEVVAELGSAELVRRVLPVYDDKHGFHFVTGGTYLGSVDRLIALLHDRLGEAEATDRWFARAVVEQERLGAPAWIARTHLDWAASLLRRGDAAAASRHVDSAAAAVANFPELIECHDRARSMSR